MIDKLLLTCLQRNKRLVIPTLGAFIRKSVDGVGVILVFVPFLKEDDGVLLNAFKEWAGVNSEEARAMLEEYVSHIKSTLKTRGGYVIEGIGVLRYDANNSLYLAKDGALPKPEPKKEEEPKSDVKEEPKAEVKQPVAPVVEVKTPVVQPQPEPVKVEPVVAPQPEPVQAPVNDLNSRFAQSEVQQPQTQQSQYAQQGQNVSLNNRFTQTEEPVQKNEPSSLNDVAQKTYKKVVTGGNDYSEQRGNSNIGDFYFNGGENGVEREQAESSQYVPNNQQPQNGFNQPQQPQQPQQVRPQQQQGAYPQKPQRSTVNDRSKMDALYASNKRNGQQTERRDNQGGVAQQVRGPQPKKKMPQKKVKKGAKGQEMPFSAKLIWILAIVAIVLTVSVIIYAFIYGDEVTLAEEVQIENMEQIVVPDSLP